MSKFKKGDYVICIDNNVDFYTDLIVNKTYKVRYVIDWCYQIGLENDSNGYNQKFFILDDKMNRKEKLEKINTTEDE